MFSDQGGNQTEERGWIAPGSFPAVFLFQMSVSLRIEAAGYGVIVYLAGQIISLDWLHRLRHKQSWLQRCQRADPHHLVWRGRLLHVRGSGSSVPEWKC